MSDKAVIDDVEAADIKLIVNRLRRAQGQLNAVIGMVEQDRPCEEVLPQLAAVSKAIDRAGYKLLATNLRRCIADGDADADKLEKLFLSLA